MLRVDLILGVNCVKIFEVSFIKPSKINRIYYFWQFPLTIKTNAAHYAPQNQEIPKKNAISSQPWLIVFSKNEKKIKIPRII